MKPLLCENDPKADCLSFLRGSPVGSVNILMFKNFLENELLPGREVSTSTVGRFLNGLGYAFTRLKKGMYIDGHERKDVIKYRVDFLNFIFEYEKSMAKYSGDDMEDVELTILPPGKNNMYS